MRLRLLLIAAFLGIAPLASAGTSSLNDWCFYINTLDLNRSCNDGAGADNFNPPATTATTFDYHVGDNNNLGTVVITLGPGSYNIFAIFNYDVGASGDSASTHNLGSITVGQVYSVDTQGDAIYTGGGSGSLYTQFTTGNLDNTNHCVSGCSDTAVSLGYENLTVPDGGTTHVSYTVSDTPPPSGFYVQQTDGAGDDIYISSNVTANPEPGTVILMAGGIALMLVGMRRKKA